MNVKQVIVIRRDLKMRRGKEIAQGSHCSMAFLIERYKKYDREFEAGTDFLLTEVERWWIDNGFKKVCVRVDSEQEIADLHEKAKSLGLSSHLIRDEGLTEFNKPEYTALAIGPDHSEKIDTITKNLTLY